MSFGNSLYKKTLIEKQNLLFIETGENLGQTEQTLRPCSFFTKTGNFKLISAQKHDREKVW